ncbi:MAG: hypothetical protein O2931_12135, partial [Planctomycetota bacterium]|nr:hypothetical protein [Planctomycetota bacterium]
ERVNDSIPRVAASLAVLYFLTYRMRTGSSIDSPCVAPNGGTVMPMDGIALGCVAITRSRVVLVWTCSARVRSTREQL